MHPDSLQEKIAAPSKRGSPRGRLISPNIWRNLSQCLTTHPKARRPFGLRKGSWRNSAATFGVPWAHPHSFHSSQEQTTDLGSGFQPSSTHLGTRSSDYFSFVTREAPGPGVSHSEPREILTPLNTNLEIHFINSYPIPHLLKFRLWRWISFALK